MTQWTVRAGAESDGDDDMAAFHFSGVGNNKDIPSQVFRRHGDERDVCARNPAREVPRRLQAIADKNTEIAHDTAYSHKVRLVAVPSAHSGAAPGAVVRGRLWGVVGHCVLHLHAQQHSRMEMTHVFPTPSPPPAHPARAVVGGRHSGVGDRRVVPAGDDVWRVTLPQLSYSLRRAPGCRTQHSDSRGPTVRSLSPAYDTALASVSLPCPARGCSVR